MLPALELLADDQVRRVVPGITEPIAEQFDLSPEEREQMLPSRLQATFVNRTHWAITYMGKAGLVARPSRGRVVITEQGHQALAKKPAKIDIAFLMGYPGFAAFRAKAKPKTNGENSAAEGAVEQTRRSSVPHQRRPGDHGPRRCLVRP